MKMGKLYAFIKYFGGFLMKFVFLTKVVGKENIPKNSGFILCCNHTHYLDVAFLVVAFKKQIHFMAKEELFQNKRVAKFMYTMGAFPVTRGAGTGGIQALKTAEEIVKSGETMGIFPEGTRSRDGSPKKAKSGVAVIASASGAPVVPVSIYYTGKLHVFKRVTLRIGKPLTPQELKMEDNSRTELRRVSTMIMDSITEQWGEGHCK